MSRIVVRLGQNSRKKKQISRFTRNGSPTQNIGAEALVTSLKNLILHIARRVHDIFQKCSSLYREIDGSSFGNEGRNLIMYIYSVALYDVYTSTTCA